MLPRNMYKYGAKWTGTDISPEQIVRAKILAQEEVDDEYGQEIYFGACLRIARCLYEWIGVEKNPEEAGHIIADGVYFFRKRWQRHDELCGEGFASANELQQKIQAGLAEQDMMILYDQGTGSENDC